MMFTDRSPEDCVRLIELLSPLSRSEMAKMLFVSPATISRLARGKTKQVPYPVADGLRRMAERAYMRACRTCKAVDSGEFWSQ